MARVTFTGKKGLRQLGSESFTGLIPTVATTFTDVNKLTGGSWIDVTAIVTEPGGAVSVQALADGGYGSYTVSGLTVGNPYIIYTDVTTYGSEATLTAISTDLNISNSVTTTDPLTVSFVATTTWVEVRLIVATNGTTNIYSNVVLQDGIIDLSSNNQGATFIGNIVSSSPAAGSVLKYLTGFTSSNYIKQEYYNPNLDYPTATVTNFYHAGWVNLDDGESGMIMSRGGGSGSSMFIKVLTNGNVEFSISDDNNSTSDIATYSGNIASGTWRFITAVYRQVYIGTSSEKIVLELWIDGELQDTVNVTAAAAIVANTNANLYYGIHDDTTLPLTGGKISMWKTAPVAPVYSEIQSMYYSEKDLFTSYTPLLAYDTIYTIDIRYTTLNKTFTSTQSSIPSIGGNRATVVSRKKYSWAVSTIPLNGNSTDLKIYTAFLESVISGESFVFDAKGTLANPDNPINCYLSSNNYTENRQQSTEYFTLSFNITEL